MIAVVVNPPEPSVARGDFLVCGMEANRCEQVGRTADRGVIALACPVLLGECCAEPPFRAVMFLAHCRLRFLHVLVAGVERTRIAAATNFARSKLASSGDCPPDSGVPIGAVQPTSPP